MASEFKGPPWASLYHAPPARVGGGVPRRKKTNLKNLTRTGTGTESEGGAGEAVIYRPVLGDNHFDPNFDVGEAIEKWSKENGIYKPAYIRKIKNKPYDGEKKGLDLINFGGLLLKETMSADDDLIRLNKDRDVEDFIVS